MKGLLLILSKADELQDIVESHLSKAFFYVKIYSASVYLKIFFM